MSYALSAQEIESCFQNVLRIDLRENRIRSFQILKKVFGLDFQPFKTLFESEYRIFDVVLPLDLKWKKDNQEFLVQDSFLELKQYLCSLSPNFFLLKKEMQDNCYRQKQNEIAEKKREEMNAVYEKYFALSNPIESEWENYLQRYEIEELQDLNNLFDSPVPILQLFRPSKIKEDKKDDRELFLP